LIQVKKSADSKFNLRVLHGARDRPVLLEDHEPEHPAASKAKIDKHFDVVIVGAGISGIGQEIQRLLERNPGTRAACAARLCDRFRRTHHRAAGVARSGASRAKAV
jgi:hypothetical protein